MTSTEISRLERMIDEIRAIRDRVCEPKNNTNPRYHALSTAIANINRALDDLRTEEAD